MSHGRARPKTSARDCPSAAVLCLNVCMARTCSTWQELAHMPWARQLPPPHSKAPPRLLNHPQELAPSAATHASCRQTPAAGQREANAPPKGRLRGGGEREVSRQNLRSHHRSRGEGLLGGVRDGFSTREGFNEGQRGSGDLGGIADGHVADGGIRRYLSSYALTPLLKPPASHLESD